MKYIIIMSLLLFGGLVGPTMVVAAEEAMVIDNDNSDTIEYSWKKEAVALVPFVNYMGQYLVDYSVNVLAHYQKETEEIYKIPNKCNVGDSAPEQCRTITIDHDGDPYSIAIKMCFLSYKDPAEVIYTLRHVIADRCCSNGYASYEIVMSKHAQ